MIRYLLDTNVVSEAHKQRPNQNVLHFLQETPGEQMFVSAFSIGELQRGAVLVEISAPHVAAELAVWIASIELDFAGRVIAFDAKVAKTWASIPQHQSRPLLDVLIAATALHHGLTLVTRNARHVAGLGVPIINPWEPA